METEIYCFHYGNRTFSFEITSQYCVSTAKKQVTSRRAKRDIPFATEKKQKTELMEMWF